MKLMTYGSDFDEIERTYSKERQGIQEKLAAVRAQLSEISEQSPEWAQLEHDKLGLELELGDAKSDFEAEKRNRLRAHAFRDEDILASRYSRHIATTLRPLGRHATARLLWHGYRTAMANASVLWDDFPVMLPVPDQEAFECLAAGRGRPEIPSPHHI